MKNNTIQIFKPFYRTDEILSEIKECLDMGWTGLGNKTVKFEEKFKKYSNLPNAHFLSSATEGLVLALKIFKDNYDWNDGDEIVTTPLTFVSSNHAIIQNRLTPVFADVDDGLCLDLDSIKRAITSKTKAVMFVGLGGNVGQYEEILSFCKKNNLKVILDAAHMAGTKVRCNSDIDSSGYTQVGLGADVTVFSFQAVKNLPTADSGMICFKEISFDQQARKLSWLGIDKDTFKRTSSLGTYKWDYDVIDYGFKCHGNSVMASMGIVGLKYLDEDNHIRRQIADKYTKGFSGIPEIKIVPHNSDCISSRHLFQIRVSSRDSIIEFLSSKNIYPGVHYKDNSQYEIYSNFDGECPNARLASNEIISLPLHLSLKNSDIEQIIYTVITGVGSCLKN
tara:strand:+ start:340 stop:1518 length:1179 start_codon:yes stop_codon:yes gene_type:complete